MNDDMKDKVEHEGETGGLQEHMSHSLNSLKGVM